jgi:hypothetical protein
MIRTSAPAPKYARKTPSSAPIAGQQQRFGQHLAHQAKPAGAQRHANRHFVPAAGPARQQHVRQVGAGDQQQQAHHGHQRQERFREQVAQTRGEARARGLHCELQLAHHGVFAGAGSFFERPPEQHRHFRARLLDRNAGFSRAINCNGPGRPATRPAAPRCPAGTPPAIRNSRGVTPTIVIGTSSTTIRLPRMAGSRLNLFFQ